MHTLRSFEAASRHNSFQKASEELFVTPSAVSHQIKSLEEFLEVKLFIRGTRKIELTSAGREYARRIGKALRMVEKATEKVTEDHGSGELNLAVAPTFLTRWLLPRMSRFNEEHPNIELELTASTGLIDFAHSETDMAVYFGDGQWEGVECEFLKQSALIPVCQPDLLKKYPIDSPEDISRHTLLHVIKRPDEWPAWFAAAGIEYRERRKGMYLSSGLLTVQAAARGLGVALADVSLVSEEIQTGELVAPLEIPLELSKSFYLVHQEDRQPTQAMRRFKRWIMAEMASDAFSEQSAQYLIGDATRNSEKGATEKGTTEKGSSG